MIPAINANMYVGAPKVHHHRASQAKRDFALRDVGAPGRAFLRLPPKSGRLSLLTNLPYHPFSTFFCISLHSLRPARCTRSPLPVITELFGNTGANVSDPVLDRLRRATLGSYDVAGELGRGGMAIVYVARDMKLERTVAIKVMDPRLNLAHGMAERFLQEAQIAARLQHPNIIVVHDIRQSDELIFFVMGLIEGGAVDELCQHGQALPVEQVRWILLQASRALAFAHEKGITHRDIKPANILVNLKGGVILTDFGIAKAVGGSSMTQSGTQIGTPTYMSPEQFSNMPTGGASDQYALGVTAYQLLTGRTPFTGDLYQLVAAHISATPVPLRELRPDCPAYLANAVMRMLEKDPEHRWPSLDDLEGVFGANMPMGGGAAGKQLALAAQQLHKQRAMKVAALTAKVPMSPTPTNASRPRMLTPQPDIARVSISPPGATIFVLGTLELRARVTRDNGDPVPDAVVQWSSSNPNVVTARTDGTLEGVAPGIAVIRAQAYDAFEEATIRVEPAPLARVTVTTPIITLQIGETVRPDVAAVDMNGVQRTDVSFVWVSHTPTVVQVDEPGGIRGLAPGDAVVEVSVGNVRRLIDVTVVRRPAVGIRIQPVERSMELGDARALRAIATDDTGEPVSHATIAWTSSAPSAIHVDSAGTALAIGPGVVQITAMVDDVSDSVELESVEPPIGSIDVVLTPNTLEVGETAAVTLLVKDATGAPRSTCGVRVWSSATTVADVDVETMSVRAVGIGLAHIEAASEEASGTAASASATITVTVVAVARIEVLPESLDLELGAVATLTVRYLDAKGRVIANATGIAESTAPRVAVIERNNAVRGASVGAAEIRVHVTNADGHTVEMRVPVRVRTAALASFAISAPRQTLVAGESINLAVTAVDTMGETMTNVSTVWLSSDESVGMVNASGQVMALRAGMLTITAEVSSSIEQLQFVVSAPPLARLSVQPFAHELIVGMPVRLTVTARDIRGNAVTPNVRWSIDPPDAARVSGNEFTALRAGAVTVRATLADQAGTGGKDGVREATAALSVREPRMESVMIVPDVLTLKLGGRRRVTLRAKLEGGRESTPSGATWCSSNTDVATVDASGEVRGVAAGNASIEALVDGKRAASRLTVRAGLLAGTSRRLPLLASAGIGVLLLGWLFWPSGADVPISTPAQASAQTSAQSSTSAPGASTPTTPATTTAPPPETKPTIDAPVAGRSVISATAGSNVGTAAVQGKRPVSTAVSGTATGTVLAAAPVVRSPQDEMTATTDAFDRSPADRAVARTTVRKLDSLESLLSPNVEQARAAFYVGRAYAALDQQDAACGALAHAKTLRAPVGLTTQIDNLRRDTGCIVAAPGEVRNSAPAAAGKSQAELKAELDSAVYRYARAFASRDANRVKAAFPGIADATLDGYRNMFRQARDITVTISDIAATGGSLSETVGSTASAVVRVLVKIRTGEVSESRTEWKARLQRTASGWQIIAME